MGYPTPRTAKGQGRDILERLDILEARQWAAPQRLASALSTATDADDLLGTGVFWVTPATPHSPPVDAHFVIEQYELDSGTRYQMANRIGTPATSIFAERWTRMKTGSGAWTDWRLISLPTTNFTPEPGGGITLGNATVSGQYGIADGIVTGRIRIVFGSTTVMAGDLQFLPPVPVLTGLSSNAHDGGGRFGDVSAGAVYDLHVLTTGSRIYARPLSSAGGFVTQSFTSATAPFTWAVGDYIEISFIYPII
ncbi:hypothetical protein SEA_PEPE25_38 [Microbacterium phage Pepe25]|nr:hypothetical protein SEA_PEPE25_38 [Microbacterium phage Pepe25]